MAKNHFVVRLLGQIISCRSFTFKLGIMAIGLGFSSVGHTQSPIQGRLQSTPQLDTTQLGITQIIEEACPQGRNQADFQARCDAIVGAANQGATSDVLTSVQQVAPEQIPSQGVSATRAAFNLIGGRLAALRAGAHGFHLAGSGSVLPINLASLSSGLGGGAGDSDSAWERLGGFVNGNYNTGNVDAELNQFGYNFNSGSTNFGLDYRFSDDLVLGAAFTYMRSESSFDHNGGTLDSNAYTGALYGNYYATENFYFDGIASIGGINYESIRHIQYSLPAETINTQTKGTPSGNQYSIGLGSGYNYALRQWLFNPYARVNYIKLDVDRFSETGGDGWAMAFNDQSVESVTTTLGGQISYALSTSWGVLMPMLRGEWHHQYKDGSRNIAVRFLGDTTTGLTFNTVTTSPDRNYFTVGIGMSATFAHGISAFFNYDALLGYRNLESHLLTLGARMEF
jgi:outer membrane lipase/esterase